MVIGERGQEQAEGTGESTGVGHSMRWDDSVALRPLGFGAHAEPLVLDWFGAGQPDLLVTALGAAGTAGRTTRIHRAVAAEPFHYEPGVHVEGLERLRALCALPN